MMFLSVALISYASLNVYAAPATEITAETNAAVYSKLDFNDTTEAEFLQKGFIAAPDELEITNSSGEVVWSQKAYDFVDDYTEAPDTVNPSLWENTKNNHQYGLFQVTDKIYQVRDYDMANLTLVKGDTGWIVFDPLMSVECSEAAMELVNENLGTYPIKAVIISHPHVDHYGGIKGVVQESDVADASLDIEDQIESGKC